MQRHQDGQRLTTDEFDLRAGAQAEFERAGQIVLDPLLDKALRMLAMCLISRQPGRWPRWLRRISTLRLGRRVAVARVLFGPARR